MPIDLFFFSFLFSVFFCSVDTRVVSIVSGSCNQSFHTSVSPQVFRTLFAILADLNYAVWTISTQLLISKSSSPFTNLLLTVQSVPITNGINVNSMFHSFSVFLQGLGTHLYFLFPSVLPCVQPERRSPLFGRFFFFFF